MMTSEEINTVIKISTEEVGFTHIKYTGGEPLLRPDIFQLLEDTRRIGHVQDIQLVTNGTLLSRYAARLKNAGLDSITVSVDAADEETYRKIRGAQLSQVINGLRASKLAGLPIRINTVLMRSNADQVEGLMQLAIETGASLKFIDLMDVNNNPEFWRKEFYPFAELRKTIERKALRVGYEEAPGGIGAPLLWYVMPNGLDVLLRDASEGTCYIDSCRTTCRYYPCQDGCISLRLTHDGHLKRCLIRNDNLVNILAPLRNGDYDKVRKLIQESFDILTSATYYPRAWQPKIVKE
jgi:cyclic pyranopterin phosphate synthase